MDTVKKKKKKKTGFCIFFFVGGKGHKKGSEGAKGKSENPFDA